MTVDCSKFSTLPRIPLAFNNLKLEALFDSGAARSLISEKVLELLKMDKSTLSPMDGFELYDVNERKLRTLGRCRIVVKFGKGIFPQEFIVTTGNFSQLCILGMDAILQHKFVLDGRERVIYRVSKEIQNAEAPILTLPVKLMIEPRSYVVCYVNRDTVSQELASGEACFVVPHPHLPEVVNIHPFVSSTTDSGDYLLIISNVSSQPVTLNKFQVLGTVQFCKEKSGFASTKPQFASVNAISELEGYDRSCAHANDLQTDQLKADIFMAYEEPLKGLLMEFSDIFAPNNYEIGRTHLIKHSIDTQGHGPIRHRPYRKPFRLQTEMKRHIEDMLKNGIIQPSNSPWAAPVLLVKKSDNTTRFVTDFRSLNKITKDDSYPIPLIDGILDKLKDRKIFSTLDLAHGFFQIPMQEDSVEKTAFVCEEGLFEYLRLPMGLKNSPSTQSRLVAVIFKDINGKICWLYMDDLLAASHSEEEHLKHLRIIFTLIRGANLRLKLKKCKFMQESVTFLGHKVTPEGVLPNPETVKKDFGCKETYESPGTTRFHWNQFVLPTIYSEFFGYSTPANIVDKKGTVKTFFVGTGTAKCI